MTGWKIFNEDLMILTLLTFFYVFVKCCIVLLALLRKFTNPCQVNQINVKLNHSC